ncbi:DUF742 domain-containing protein [Streptosporangium sp. NPDC006007]|uniref:DUF742 domain-containing protein n=1 Tax=Streptosporangium sp. NPDC006007 TaxID=3154575 RepID=UPI0033A453F3
MKGEHRGGWGGYGAPQGGFEGYGPPGNLPSGYSPLQGGTAGYDPSREGAEGYGPPGNGSSGYGASRDERSPYEWLYEPSYGGPPGEPDDEPDEESDDEPYEEESSLVRLYTVTGGRTVPRSRLAMEALVSSTTSAGLGLSYVREYRAINELCGQVRSIAEISALLGIPLGVVRVLISDMESEGLVRVHQPRLNGNGPDLGLLERVLSGLHRL